MDDLKYKIIAGSFSGLCEVLITHPLDYIKTLLQYNNNKISCKTYNFYRGITPRIFGVVPMRTIFWTTLEGSKYYLPDNIKDTDRLILSGLFAGIAQSAIDVPIENMKIQRMIRNNKFCDINLYNGSSVTITRNVGFAIILNLFLHLGNDHSNKSIDFFRAGVGAVVASIITQPLDYFKTQIQSNKTIYDIRLKALFSGYLTRASMGFINMSIGYSVFSTINDLIT